MSTTRRAASWLAALGALLAPVAAAAGDPSTTPGPGRIKRTLRSFLSDDDKAAGRGLHLGPFTPGFETVSSGAGAAPIVHFWLPEIGGTPVGIHASASYSIIKYQYYDLQVGLVPHEGARLPRVGRGPSAAVILGDLEKTAATVGFNIYASARYRDYPREDYYGLGQASLQANRTDYRMSDGLYEGVLRLRLGHLSLMGRTGLLQTSIRSGTDSAFPDTASAYDEQSAPGLFSSPDFVHVSAGAWLELRDEPGNPHRGAVLGVAFSRFDDRHGDAFQFSRATLDARQYLRLGSNRNVLALRQVTSLDAPDEGSSVPFYMQSSLGGSAFLRGFSSTRFRDEKLLALAGEYRFEVHPKVELALIYESGKVFARLDEFDGRDLRRSYGIGLRLKSPRKVRFRVDVLRSREGTRVHLKLAPSF